MLRFYRELKMEEFENKIENKNYHFEINILKDVDVGIENGKGGQWRN